MLDLIVSVPDHCLSFYFSPDFLKSYCLLWSQMVMPLPFTVAKTHICIYSSSNKMISIVMAISNRFTESVVKRNRFTVLAFIHIIIFSN